MNKIKKIIIAVVTCFCLSVVVYGAEHRETVTVDNPNPTKFSYGDELTPNIVFNNDYSFEINPSLNLIYQLDKGNGYEDVSYEEFSDLYSMKLNDEWTTSDYNTFAYNKKLDSSKSTTNLVDSITVTTDKSKQLLPFKLIIEGIGEYE